MKTIESNKPWHQHPLVWMMLAIPFSAVIMGGVMLWLAIDTDDGLVADDYYKQGLAINDVISLDKRAVELQLKAVIKYDVSSNVINLEFEKGLLSEYPPLLHLNLQHATRANSDVSVELNRGIENHYIGYLKQPISIGVWYFELKEADWKLTMRSHVRANNLIQLQSNY